MSAGTIITKGLGGAALITRGYGQASGGGPVAPISILTAGDISLMQAIASSVLMTTPCTIQRKTLTSDAMGGYSEAWNTLSSPYCRVAPARNLDVEQIDLSRLEQLDRYTIYLPVGQDISIRDRIVAMGTTFEVVSVAAPRTIEVTRVVQCIVVVS